YDYLWNIGDRTALTSSGWFEPVDNGPRVYDVGLFFNRPDRTGLYIGYRQTDPLQSRVVTAAVNYIFSPKYALTAATSYDFGTGQAQSNTLVLTRLGSDLQVSLGLNYNSLQQSFGFTFEIMPVLLPANRRIGALSMLGNQGGLFGR